MQGKIYVVGIGPGGEGHISPAAVDAIADSDVVLGYGTYMKLIAHLTDGKESRQSGMRKEIERAKHALELALEGKTVAVVSSGDAGVYGMAGIVYEIALGKTEIEVIPGITAATSAASSLGAPIMHDYATISLSDLLTPWEKITKRVRAAAEADMIIVLYNPRSFGRPDHMQKVREIVMEYRSGNTPVGFVRNAKREGEEVTVSTLADLPVDRIDMVTTVIIGNSETYIQNGVMVTPRGYHKKEEYNDK